MSFGAAAVPRLPGESNKESLPWATDDKKSNTKKFSYKSRTNKIPLRDKLKQAEIDKTLDEQEREARIRANKQLAERRKREAEKKAAQKGILKKGATSSDYVTLTSDQLESIIASLSQVQGNIKTNAVHVDIDKNHHLKLTVDKPESRGSDKSIASSQQLESVLNLAKKVKTSNDTPSKDARSHVEVSQQRQPNHSTSKPQASQRRSKKQVVLDFDFDGNEKEKAIKTKQKSGKVEPKSKTAITPPDTDDDTPVFVRQPKKVVIVDDTPANESKDTKAVAEPEGKALNTGEQSPLDARASVELSPRQKQLLLPRAHMTKAEKKRLEWELQNVESEKLNQERQAQQTSYFGSKTTSSQKSQNSKTDTLTPSATLREQKSQSNPTGNSLSANGDVTAKTKLPITVEPDFVPGLEGMLADATHLKPSVPSNAYVKNVDTSQATTTSKKPLPTYEPLSKAQMKKLQWEKERAAALPDYNPWGKPGPGVRPASIDTQPSPPAPESDNKPAAVSAAGLNIHVLGHLGKENGFTNPDRGAPTSLIGLENKPRQQTEQLQVRTSLSKAEMLKLKWAAERANATEEYNPFGKPGAGAPIRTDSGTVLTSYHSRQNQVQKQVEDKSMGNHGYDSKQDAWSDTPERRQQQQQLSSQLSVEPSQVPGLDLNSSHHSYGGNPPYSQQTSEEEKPRNYLRGQLVNLDPITLKEREEQRKKQIEHQEAIRKQVEEKQRQKREEEMRRRKEDAELEEKYRMEMTSHQKQDEIKKKVTQQKEAKDMSRADLVAEAMLKARQEAELLKARKRLEKLKAAGHDISNLQAAYEEKFSPRLGNNVSDYLTPRVGASTSRSHHTVLSPRLDNSTVEPLSIPGLDLTPRGRNTNYEQRTPRRNQLSEKENESPVRELGVQTEPLPSLRSTQSRQGQRSQKQETSRDKKHIRVISGPKARRQQKKPQEAKPWGWKNQDGKKFTGQSKRDPFYETKEVEKMERHQVRKEQLLKQSPVKSVAPGRLQSKAGTFVVEANSNRIPNGKSKSRMEQAPSTQGKSLKSNQMAAQASTHNTSSSNNNGEPHQSQAMQKTPVKSMSDDNSAVKKPAVPVIPATKRADPNNGSSAGIDSAFDPFVPYRRTDDVLSPTANQKTPAISREATHVVQAREAYYKSTQPAQFGVQMENIADHQPVTSHSNTSAVQSQYTKDPLYNPSLITKHPTDRQLQMLDSLKLMRQGLMAKKREFGFSPDLQSPYSGMTPMDDSNM